MFFCEERMAHLKINGLVQIRSTNRSKHTRASQWKEAVIEIVERKQKVNLVVSFKWEERRRVFQLGDNVTGVVVSGELGLYHLDLTLRDDTSLLIDKLSATDVEHLKSFLDSSTPCETQQPMEPNNNQDDSESSDPLCREQEAACGSMNTTPEGGTSLSRKTPLSMSNITGSQKRGEKQGRKRKTEPSPSSSVEMNKDILKENTPEQKRKSRRYYSRNRGGKAEKAVALREQEKRSNWKLEPAFTSKSYGKATLDGTILPIATCSDDRDVSIFGLEIITHNGVQSLSDPYLNQLKREGFPNLGNTCYMNSILQSVFGIPTFAKDLLTQGIPWEKVSYDDLIMPLSQLLVLKDIRDVEIKGELLTNVKKTISTVADTFSGNDQNDAHEFLSLCLDQLKLNMEKVNAMWSIDRKNPYAATKRFVCPVSANFEFELHSSIICEGCGEATLKSEVSNYLSIDLHHGTKTHPLSIQKSFDLFFTPEKIEHNCEKCKNKNSVLKYTLRRLPRVLIVHLKRYQVSTDLMPVKSEQPVEISKYLNITSHCHENKKLPFPLVNTPPNFPQGLIPDFFCHSISSKKMTSEFCDPMVLQVGSSIDAEIQSFQIMYEDEDTDEEQQQRGLESGSMLEPELVKTENRILRQKTSLATDSMMGDGYSFLPMLCEPLSIQDPGLAEMGLQEVPENPEFKNYEKINIFGKPDGHTNIELSRLYQSHGSRIKGLFLPASLASVSSQEDPEKDLSRSPEFPEDDPHSFAFSSDDSKDMEMGDDLQNYRLVSVVSHFGSSPNSGHYVSDVYDFQRKAWLLYSDVQVFESSDPSIQENRLNSGYIFFYMHNEIFEELLKKASECKLFSTSKEERRDIDYFSSLLNGLTYILEEF
ncbi:ubiquitin carboxyl-terminal hydrolase 29 [Mastomys coucha]|uniref:ubiquitin carboxyl-terminal hydrolase 29 n=1 Tax=Mastomys coucha TaxID=35658 RepID=UPI001262468D|nr:ubiquitin carboxyl-terminal hydrolase 29 [Mastomys coucha]XP_031241175.1 ubiquitin carboxyl-terminal hydrolase 29 [Mastomys coucha]XP_031241176.1 ubiquitin carboxyl-terminal hydrolase 29 [Mastomys coucha]XP_031241177.1 ubiquitin carboxyl-terminal hydrolase 29 [Mastomys coucha]XP_031241178.1 ubiquitin carboxyl-terminal hydrolase 29 [Mastomys coucha]